MFSPSEAGVAIPSGTFNSTQTQSDQISDLYKGIVVLFNVSARVDGTYTLEIDGKDPASLQYYQILVGTGIVATGMNVYRVYPGLIAVANATVNDVLPENWRIKVTAVGAVSGATYSVGYSLIP